MKKGKITWLGKYPNQAALDTQRDKVGLNAYQREYLLKVVPEEGADVHEDWIKYYDKVPPEMENGLSGTGIVGLQPVISINEAREEYFGLDGVDKGDKNSLKDDPIPWRTGNLLHSFRFESGKLQARWFPTARYAAFVEYGRGAVYPQKAKMLSWINESGDRVFARFSKPSKPRPFMKKIVEKSQKDVQSLFRQAGDIIVREIVSLSN